MHSRECRDTEWRVRSKERLCEVFVPRRGFTPHAVTFYLGPDNRRARGACPASNPDRRVCSRSLQ